VHNSDAAELTEDSLEQLTLLSEPDEDSDIAVERPHPTTITLKKGLEMTDDIVSHCFEVDHFMDSCLKLKHDMKVVTAPYKEVYKDMQKNAKQSVA
jgi:hypothetical protein